MIEREVGEIVEDDGKKHQAVKNLSCMSCSQQPCCHTDQWLETFGFCSRKYRKDKQNIGWRLVK